jgi:hypothetical protein
MRNNHSLVRPGLLAVIGAFCFALAVAVSKLPAQEAKDSSKSAPAELQRKLRTPGPEHEQLASYAGAWNVEIKMGGGGAAIVYHGAANNRMIAGRRFLQIEYQAMGKTDEIDGTIIVGFDSRHKRFTLVAMDSFGPYFVTSQGQRNEKSNKIRMAGTDDDPMMKAMGFTKEFVHVLDLRSKDEYAVEIWFVDTRNAARREFKFMDYVFKRK